MTFNSFFFISEEQFVLAMFHFAPREITGTVTAFAEMNIIESKLCLHFIINLLDTKRHIFVNYNIYLWITLSGG